jgi:iron(III) transport system substrate-binding protein
MKQKNVRRGVLVGTLTLAAIAGMVSAQQKQVNVLCSVNLPWCEALAAAYQKETSTKLNFVRLSTAEGLARLRAEKANPTFDVWYGGTGDPHFEAWLTGLTTFYKVKDYENLRRDLRFAVGLSYVPINQGILGIGINPNVFKSKNLPPVKCWADLTKPAYKGLVQVSNPNTSGTAYTFMVTLVTIFGEEKAFDLMGRIHPNVSEYTRSGVAPRIALGNGSAAIGIQFMSDLVDFKKQGFPVDIVAPCEGTGYEIGGMSLVKGTRNVTNAKAFMDWAVTPAAQVIGPNLGTYVLPSNTRTPVDKDTPDPKDFKLITLDFKKWGTPSVREPLIKRWTNEIFPLPR